MKVYEITVNMDDDSTGLLRNSFVDSPAVEVNKIDFSNETIQLKFSEDKSEQKFISVSMIADTVIPRINNFTGELYGVIFTKNSINNIVNKFIMEGNIHEVSFQHTDELVKDVYLVEHFITKTGVKEAPIFEGLPEGSWVTTYYVPNTEQYNTLCHDDTFNGFSIELNALLEQYLFNEFETIEKTELSIENNIKAILSNENLSDDEKEIKIKSELIDYSKINENKLDK